MAKGYRRTDYRATIYDGHTHIERRVYRDVSGYRYVRINGFYFDIDFDLSKRFEITVWYDG